MKVQFASHLKFWKETILKQFHFKSYIARLREHQSSYILLKKMAACIIYSEGNFEILPTILRNKVNGLFVLLKICPVCLLFQTTFFFKFPVIIYVLKLKYNQAFLT